MYRKVPRVRIPHSPNLNAALIRKTDAMEKRKFTDEELQQYIHGYKSKTLDGVNRDTVELYERGNKTDVVIGNQLMVLSSAFVTIIGGFVVIQNQVVNNQVRFVIFLTLTSFLISLLSGLKNLHDTRNFWVKLAEHKHKEGSIVLDDNSKDYEELDTFRTNLQEYRDSAPVKSNESGRNIQMWSFLAGVVFLVIATIALLFSAPSGGERFKAEQSHKPSRHYMRQ